MAEAKNDLITVVMAAGKGTRMRSDRAKVLHRLNGRPLIHYVLETALALGSRRIIVIVGHQSESVKRELSGWPVEFAVQEEQLGTGHAVRQAGPLLTGETGTVLVLAGDTPLIRPATLEALIHAHRRAAAAASVLTARVADPTGLGRILRGDDGRIDRIVEEKDATGEQRALREINTSTYCFELAQLLQALERLTPENRQREFYLTDTIAILRAQGHRIADAAAGAPRETTGVNTPEHLAAAESWLREQARERAANRGKNS